VINVRFDAPLALCRVGPKSEIGGRFMSTRP
jgi:hypothetical protein